MSDAWDEIQAIKIKRNSLRERLEKRKKERRDILGTSAVLPSSSTVNSSTIKTNESKTQLNEIFTTVDNGKNKRNSKTNNKSNITNFSVLLFIYSICIYFRIGSRN